MRLTLAYPNNGTQIVIDVDDAQALANLYDKRLGQDIDGGVLGEQFSGYLFRLCGGFDKQGFPMKQGLITPRRATPLLRAGVSCYRPRKAGERKRKTVRGCIISPEISALHLVVLEKGPADVKGLTDVTVPRRYSPKIANRIREQFGLAKDAKVEDYVMKREVKPGKFTQPKVQRLITTRRLAHKKRMLDQRKSRKEESARKAELYKNMVAAAQSQK